MGKYSSYLLRCVRREDEVGALARLVATKYIGELPVEFGHGRLISLLRERNERECHIEAAYCAMEEFSTEVN